MLLPSTSARPPPDSRNAAAPLAFALFWSAAGRTLGMHLFRVRVRDGSGRAPGVGRAIVRALVTWISIVPLFAGYLPVLFDRRRRGLPDLVAATEVVYSEPEG